MKINPKIKFMAVANTVHQDVAITAEELPEPLKEFLAKEEQKTPGPDVLHQQVFIDRIVTTTVKVVTIRQSE